MKLNRHLLVNDQTLHTAEERVLLDLSSPGRAEFLVEASKGGIPRLARVSFDLAWSQSDGWQRLFDGYVDAVTPVDAKRQRLFCREWAGALALSLPLSLRNCTAMEVCAEITHHTGISISIPVIDKRIPHFHNLGTGYQALDQIGTLFEIADYFWQQQGGGVVYAGSWKNSRYRGREAELPDSMFSEHLSNVSARILAVPALRPGVVLNGNRIQSLEFQGNEMVIAWKTQ